MNKLKANGFWVGVGTAGAIVAALFAGWVLPAWSRQETSKAKIASVGTELSSLYQTPIPGFPDGTPGVPGKSDQSQWEERRKEYLRDYQQIAGFYRASDKVLEKYFDNLPQITHDLFKTKYLDAANQLETRLKSRQILVGLGTGEDPAKDGQFGFNWVDFEKLNLGAMPDAQRAATVRDLQKRFRICEQIGATCLTGGITVERLCDVYFFRQIGVSRSGESARPANEFKIEYKDIASDAGISDGGRNFEEPLLPDSGEKVEVPAGEEPPPDATTKPPPQKKYLGQTITFGLAVNLPYADVPKFVAELISCRNSIIINVAGARVLVRAQNELVEEDSVKVPEGDPAKAAEIVAAKKKSIEQKAKPVSVQLQLLCQAVDFDETALVSKLLQP